MQQGTQMKTHKKLQKFLSHSLSNCLASYLINKYASRFKYWILITWKSTSEHNNQHWYFVTIYVRLSLATPSLALFPFSARFAKICNNECLLLPSVPYTIDTIILQGSDHNVSHTHTTHAHTQTHTQTHTHKHTHNTHTHTRTHRTHTHNTHTRTHTQDD